jgi:hypothetical protein
VAGLRAGIPNIERRKRFDRIAGFLTIAWLILTADQQLDVSSTKHKARLKIAIEGYQ